VRPESREARFTALYEAELDAVRAYAWRRGPDKADDVVAETFLVAWRRLDDVPSDARPWLIGIARNVRLNEARADRRRSALGRRLASAEPRSAGDATPAVAGELGRALGALSERDREILLLAAWEELDAAGIGAVVGCTRATAAVRLHRARRRLAALLDRDPLPSPTLGGASDAR
jgi:RNA polymerase sigma-70 factor, ECF subfamily